MICLMITGILFGTFYIIEYGLPYGEEAYDQAVEVEAQTQSTTLSVDDEGTADTNDAQVSVTLTSDELGSIDGGTIIGTYLENGTQITVTQYSSGTGNSKITWYIADIYVEDISQLSACFAESTYGRSITDTVLNMAEETASILAVNGDYYSQQKNNIVIRNGELYQEGDTSMDLCVLYKDGTIQTYDAGKIMASQALENGAWQAWNFGPALLEDDGSAKISFNTSGHVASRNPRTAIGYYEPGHYCLVVVDGRSDGYSCGMTLSELADLFEDLGCVQAYNLDGGKSSVMVFNGEVVNQPSDGGREVSDAILVG